MFGFILSDGSFVAERRPAHGRSETTKGGGINRTAACVDLGWALYIPRVRSSDLLGMAPLSFQ